MTHRHDRSFRADRVVREMSRERFKDVLRGTRRIENKREAMREEAEEQDALVDERDEERDVQELRTFFEEEGIELI